MLCRSLYWQSYIYVLATIVSASWWPIDRMQAFKTSTLDTSLDLDFLLIYLYILNGMYTKHNCSLRIKNSHHLLLLAIPIRSCQPQPIKIQYSQYLKFRRIFLWRLHLSLHLFIHLTWVLWVMQEVGCRGFPTQSVWNLMTRVGLRGNERKAAIHRLIEVAVRASCWLWQKREDTCCKRGGEGQWPVTADLPTRECCR